MIRFCFPLLLFASLSLFGQSSIQGFVKDKDTKEALIGVNILLEGSSKGTVSDTFGHYEIKVDKPGEYRLQFSYVGFESAILTAKTYEDKTLRLDVQLLPGRFELNDIVVSANPDKNLDYISTIDIRLRPISTSQDVLRIIPGLFIAQHAGGGKAEQIFLRGFDIDHGTDINLSVDGLPVNMVSHAHGQGYSDLHFVIPETVESVDFNKGPYYADKGDFTTAGYAAFQTKRKPEHNLFKLEGGEFGQKRGVLLLNLLNNKSKSREENAYIAGEAFGMNGYFESPQNFERFNLFGKYTHRWNDRSMFTATASSFASKWNASGQIPERAVEQRSISRFGSIDNTEGGETSRTNVSLQYLTTLSNGSLIESQMYYSRYDFNLYSNFTFFLNDPVNGDQINQQEGRNIIGYNGSYSSQKMLFGKLLDHSAGVQIRHDDINNIRLSHTFQRERLEDFKRGNIGETNLGIYINEKIELNQYFSLSTALRFDYFHFQYEDQLSLQTKSKTANLFSPKFTLDFSPNQNVSFYLKAGQGFHSNDARVVVDQKVNNTLPKATGIDLGTLFKPSKNLLINAAIWALDLRQEFVYVGDVGIVEPSGATLRTGADLSIRYQLNNWIFADIDLNYTLPRTIDAPKGKNYIPLAPILSSVAGISFQNKNGLNGSIRSRMIGDRPANEDNSLVANGYFLLDTNINYTKSKYEIGLSAENIFNQKWKEAQFATTSRLQSETDPVNEIHFTPGSPLFLKLKFTVFF